MDKISVVVCDDSALMRNVITKIVEEIDGFEVIAKAENGVDLLEKLQNIRPDVILLDIEMPKMNGLEFLAVCKQRKIRIPVIILSSIAKEGAAVTMKCLELGAADFITKPGGGSVTLKISDVSNEIVEYIAAYGRTQAFINGKHVPDPDYFQHQIKLKEAARFVAQRKGENAAKLASISQNDISPLSTYTPSKPKEPAVIVPEKEGGPIELIAIGVSTGGPNALRDMFKKLDPNLNQPILVVQHMPAGFTKEFADSLNAICPLTVTEAQDSEKIANGHIYIAPGSHHLTVERRGVFNYIKITDEDPRNGHRPSCDVLFESVAKVFGNRALGVIMTGMGRDGAAQLAQMRKKGAWTLGQDEKSSIVYGMPKVAYEMGAVQKQVPLDSLAQEINILAKEHLVH